jgi:gliding motility-associated-like protein
MKLLKVISCAKEIIILGSLFLFTVLNVKAQQKFQLCDEAIIKNYIVKINDGKLEYIDIQPSLYYQVNNNTLLVKYDKIGIFVITTSAINESCNAYKDLIVEVIECLETRIYIPNSFSPNGDGINDVFKCYGVNIYEYKLEIWNRWGELLFVSNNIKNGWDGYYKDQLAFSGLYPGRVIYKDVKGIFYLKNIKIHLI